MASKRADVQPKRKPKPKPQQKLADPVAELLSASELDQKLTELDADSRVALLRKENARLHKRLDNAEAGVDIIRHAFDQAYSEPLGIHIPPPKPQRKRKLREEAMLHLTDIHFGKETKTYNIAVAEERLQKCTHATLEILELRRTTADIDTLHLMLGGDMVEGEGAIFPGQAHEIDQDLMQQAVKNGPEILCNQLAPLLREFKTIHVKGVPGNHGRQGKFANKRTNADSLFYEILRWCARYAFDEATNRRIVWDLPLDRPRGDEWWAHTRICDRWGVLMVHGDQIRGQLGFPWYGVGKKLAGWIDTIPLYFHILLFGHFHTYSTFDVNHRIVMATGSTESSNAYAAENMAASGIPKQRLSFFNQRWGLLSDHQLILEER